MFIYWASLPHFPLRIKALFENLGFLIFSNAVIFAAGGWFISDLQCQKVTFVGVEAKNVVKKLKKPKLLEIA